jgi:hypothetical protein
VLNVGSEFHVPAASGAVMYAAPELVPHYVEVHRYLPPAEYIEAVVAYRAPEISWEAIRNYWMSQLPPFCAPSRGKRLVPMLRQAAGRYRYAIKKGGATFASELEPSEQAAICGAAIKLARSGMRV